MPVSVLPVYFTINAVPLQHLRPYCESTLQLRLLEEYGRPGFCGVVQISLSDFSIMSRAELS